MAVRKGKASLAKLLDPRVEADAFRKKIDNFLESTSGVVMRRSSQVGSTEAGAEVSETGSQLVPLLTSSMPSGATLMYQWRNNHALPVFPATSVR